MRIVHIAPNASFTPGLGYQENILPKYQQKLGHDVTLIVSNWSRPNGKLQLVPCSDEICSDGFRVIRKAVKTSKRIKAINELAYMSVYDDLCELKPDMVFFHGFVSLTIRDVVKYKKRINKDLYIVQDNHEDYNIGRDPSHGFKSRTYCAIVRCFHKSYRRYIDKVYGVTPWRTTYAEKVYGADPRKCDTLIMGADDDLMDLSRKNEYKNNLRSKYEIPADAFVIVTGGKIDRRKRILPLMEACRDIDRIRLIVFGVIHDEVMEDFRNLAASAQNIIYTGWMDNPSIYKLLMGADLAVFPGQHSVLWEQACAAKTPCVFGRWEGMEHVNNGGNSAFIDDYSPEAIRKVILSLVYTEKYDEMKRIAESERTDIYMYGTIARKTIDDYDAKRKR